MSTAKLAMERSPRSVASRAGKQEGARPIVVWRPGREYLGQLLATGGALLVSDQLCVAFSFVVAAMAVDGSLMASSGLFALGVAWCQIVLLVMFALGAYPGVGLHPVVEMRNSIVAVTLSLVVFLAGVMHFDANAVGHALALEIAWCIAVPVLPLGRSMTRRVLCRFSWWGQRALVLGGGAEATAIFRSLQANRRHGLHPVGIVSDACEQWRDGGVDSGVYLGPLEEAAELAAEHRASWAVMSWREALDPRTRLLARNIGVPHLLVVATDLTEFPSLWNESTDFGGLPTLRIRDHSQLSEWTKRVMDLAIVVCLGLPALIVSIVIASLIKITSSGPVFYVHDRIGRGGRRFKAWKFRTMYEDAEDKLKECLAANPEFRDEWDQLRKIRHDPRITRFGRWLRKTSLDELPQVWNVLKGDMSLVGPRPILVDEVAKYGDTYALYTRVRPGITGLWQISGRNDLSYEQRLRLVACYTRNWSLWLDLYILASTLRVMVTQEGAY